ncbi:hypothetical protein AGMMS50267_08850 [Spirochaetia bacterium]|nr:hypothetical protein AGMMS50267_08850 [Spirochaetia bacterium]
MEELQSTEVLDREILEDARKKAARILRTADETAASTGEAWDAKTSGALDALKQRYARRLEASRNEIMARLPLDTRRSRLEKIDTLLHDAAAAYLSSFSREKLLALLESELKSRAGELEDRGLEGRSRQPLPVRYRHLTPAEVEKILKKVFAGDTWNIAEATGAFLHAGRFPGIIIDTQAVRITVSAEAAVERLLEDRRGELASALLGEGALEDPRELNHA